MKYSIKTASGFSLVSAFLSTACGGDMTTLAEQAPHLGQVQQSIVAATSGDAPEQVMLVLTARPSNGGVGLDACTGTLIAPRVVLTAAHCLEGNTDSFVYWGDDIEGDIEQLNFGPGGLTAPPAGEPDVDWAQSSGTLAHPDYDPALLFPDLGLLYLDRDMPFEPLPLANFRLGSWLEGSTVGLAGWGATAVLNDDLSGASGEGQLRAGQAVLLGSPSQFDFDPSDPNPGLLDAQIRQTLIKTDGSGSNSNTCAGDSGSPLLLDQGAGPLVAGVSYFTGPGCEDFSLFTRLDSFLYPFLQESLNLGGKRPVRPRVECLRPNSEGGFRAYLGYDNENLIPMEITTGDWRNQLPFDSQNVRPTTFSPGVHAFSSAVDFPFYQTLSWQLVPENGYGANVVANQWITPMCGPEQALATACVDSCQIQGQVDCDFPVPTIDECTQLCSDLPPILTNCEEDFVAVLECQADSVPEQWACGLSGPELPSCASEEAALTSCIFGI